MHTPSRPNPRDRAYYDERARVARQVRKALADKTPNDADPFEGVVLGGDPTLVLESLPGVRR